MGLVVDELCQVWGQSCGSQGSCQFYDVNSLSYRLTYLAIAVNGNLMVYSILHAAV